MRPRPSRARLVGIVTLAAAAAWAGCDDEAQEAAEGTKAEAATGEDEGAAANPEAEGPAGEDGAGQSGSAPSGAGFEWTERPTLASIPDVPVGGVVQGAPFDIESVCFEPRFGQWTLVLSDAELEAPTDPPPPDARSLTLTELPAHLGQGEHRREMREVGGSLWRIRSGEGAELTTWSAPHAFVLEIDEWEVDPWDAEGPLFQEAGRASGRIAVVHEASDGLSRAWVAGRFEDAVVRYMGKPGWLAEPAPEPGAGSE